MKIVAAVLLLGTLVSGRPEPPAPGYSTTRQDAFSAPSFDAPSSSYGPPSGAYSAPSSTYGAPSGAYSAPSSRYGAPSSAYSAPSSTYGAPSGAYSAPSSRYGAPSSSSRYANAPSASKTSFRLGGRSSSRRNSLSGRYGAPAVTAAIFRSPSLSSMYGAPSSTYGAPSSSYSSPGASNSFNGAPSPVYGAPGGGFNGYPDPKALLAQDDLSEPANYDFSYGVKDAYSGSDFGHQENREDDSAQGEYRVLLPDGRTQVVEYEADDGGYHPRIHYEEPSGPYAASQRSNGPY